MTTITLKKISEFDKMNPIQKSSSNIDAVIQSDDIDPDKRSIKDPDEPSDLGPEAPQTLGPPAKAWYRQLIHEPFLFIYTFANFVISTPRTNLFMDRACALNLNYSAEICSNLSLTEYTEQHDQVQMIANNYNLYSSLLMAAPPALISIYLAPWADMYGRKLPVYISLCGSLIYDAGMVYYSTAKQAPLYHALLYAIPAGLTGNLISVQSCVYTVASEKTEVKHRMKRYAVLELAYGMGIILGSLLAGTLVGLLGYVPVFCAGLVLHALTMIYLFLFIKDDRLKKQANFRTKFLDFFSCENFKDNFRTATKVRENSGRAQIGLLLLSMAIIYLNYTSLSDILFLFCNKMYRWDLSQYSQVSTGGIIAMIVFLSIALPILIKKFKVQDYWLGLIGTVSLLSQTLIRAFAYYPWLYYLSMVAGLLSGTAPFAVRSRIARLVDDEELGKLFAVVATMENLVPIPGTVFFNRVYGSSLTFYPGLAFVIGAAMLLIPFGVFAWLGRLPQPSKVSQDKEALTTAATEVYQ